MKLYIIYTLKNGVEYWYQLRLKDSEVVQRLIDILKDNDSITKIRMVW